MPGDVRRLGLAASLPERHSDGDAWRTAVLGRILADARSARRPHDLDASGKREIPWVDIGGPTPRKSWTLKT